MIKVLIVDDSALVRRVLSEILSNAPGITVVDTAQDPLVARDKIKQHNPDVITLDVEMPRMDGFELTRQVRASETLKHIPIIVITSRAGQRHRDKAISLGATEYLSKPYQEDQLLDTICSIVPHARIFSGRGSA